MLWASAVIAATAKTRSPFRVGFHPCHVNPDCVPCVVWTMLGVIVSLRLEAGPPLSLRTAAGRFPFPRALLFSPASDCPLFL